MRGVAKTIILAVLAGMFILLGYLLYTNVLYITSEPEQFQMEPAERNQSSFQGDFQFYPDMRFNKRTISYSIDSSCSEQKKERTLAALGVLSNETNLLDFYPTSQNPDILISCKDIEIIEEDYFVSGEGGPVGLINTSRYYVIENGTVLLLYNQSSCDWYNVELHELLHVFGFKHSENKESIMYNITYCNQVLTDDIIEELERLYSIPELPDLYFKNAKATKQDVYLSIEVEITNQGLVKSGKVILELYADEKKIDEFEFEEIDYGGGRYLKVENIRLPSRDVKKLKFIIIDGEELDTENNIIELVLA